MDNKAEGRLANRIAGHSSQVVPHSPADSDKILHYPLLRSDRAPYAHAAAWAQHPTNVGVEQRRLLPKSFATLRCAPLREPLAQHRLKRFATCRLGNKAGK